MFSRSAILFVLCISVISVCRAEVALVEVYSSAMRVKSIYISFWKTSILNDEYNPDDILNIAGKICNANSTGSIMDECFLMYENFNYDWIILANSSEYLNSIYALNRELQATASNPFRIVSIIFNNETVSHNETQTDYSTPLFSVNNQNYAELIQYDISDRSDNWMINLLYSQMDNLQQGRLTFYLSIGLTSLMIVLTLGWHGLAWRVEGRFSTPIQKGFTVLIYLRLILSLLTVYFVYLCMKTFSIDNFADNLTKIYVETIIVTLNAVLQTLVWFNILIIAYGWQIHRGFFTRNELRNLVIVFLLLYLLICFDQIIDMIINVKLWEPSDIKNFVLYSLLTYATVRYCEKSKAILRRRYIYALNFSREYSPALRLKIRFMNLHIMAALIYSVTYLAIILINKTIVKDLISNQLKMMFYYYVDTFGFLMFALIYYPKNLPEYFTVFYDETARSYEDAKFNIYSIKLNSAIVVDSNVVTANGFNHFNSPMSAEKITKKEVKEIKENQMIPVIIINPTFELFAGVNILEHVNVGLRK